MTENLDPGKQEVPETNDTQAEGAEQLGFTDILIGIISSPASTLRTLSQAEMKTSHWLFPLLLLVLSVIISTVVMMSNPDIKSFTKEKARQNTEKYMQDRVKSGKMTQTDADLAIKRSEEQLDAIGSPKAMIIQSVSIIVITFIFFFVVAGYFYFISQFFLGAEFTYKHAMTAYGLALYVGIFEVIITLLYSLVIGKTGDVSVAGLIGYENKDILRFILSKLNVFSIWSYGLLGIGLAILGKSDNIKKYVMMVFASWILFSLAWFGITKLVPMIEAFS
ncbi:MAG: YIP1 family protein [Ignavibacteriales bacterium]|nr:YIP1 family protein [Ignavibacteriales bacterium]